MSDQNPFTQISERENEERTFLHDLASPICATQFLLEGLLEELKKESKLNENDIVSLEQAIQQLEKATGMITQRKQALVHKAGE